MIIFTGHMIDDPSRKPPRFPESCEDVARQAIRNALLQEIATIQTRDEEKPAVVAISGGACGGDLLFLEECFRAEIVPFMFLVFPRDLFVATSVAFAGQHWVQRFNKLYEDIDHANQVYTPDSTTLVPFSQNASLSIWERNNEWMLRNGLAIRSIRTTIIALWNGEGIHRPGGTADMIKQAHNHGAHSVILDTNTLCF